MEAITQWPGFINLYGACMRFAYPSHYTWHIGMAFNEAWQSYNSSNSSSCSCCLLCSSLSSSRRLEYTPRQMTAFVARAFPQERAIAWIAAHRTPVHSYIRTFVHPDIISQSCTESRSPCTTPLLQASQGKRIT